MPLRAYNVHPNSAYPTTNPSPKDGRPRGFSLDETKLFWIKRVKTEGQANALLEKVRQKGFQRAEKRWVNALYRVMIPIQNVTRVPAPNPGKHKRRERATYMRSMRREGKSPRKPGTDYAKFKYKVKSSMARGRVMKSPAEQRYLTRSNQMNSRRRNTPGGVDQPTVRELELFIDNTGSLYTQQTTPILKNLAAKKARGVYKHAGAVKLFRYLVDNADKMYHAGVDSVGRIPRGTGVSSSTATRNQVAENLAHGFEVEYDLGNYSHLLPKKYQSKSNPRLEPITARQILSAAGAPLGGSFHTLSSRTVDDLLSYAAQYKYRKPASASGSKGRYWHDHLQKVAAKSSRNPGGKRTMHEYDIYWGPTGQKIGTVTASTAKAAKAKAPAPYKQYKGEIYVEDRGPIARNPYRGMGREATRARKRVARSLGYKFTKHVTDWKKEAYQTRSTQRRRAARGGAGPRANPGGNLYVKRVGASAGLMDARDGKPMRKAAGLFDHFENAFGNSFIVSRDHSAADSGAFSAAELTREWNRYKKDRANFIAGYKFGYRQGKAGFKGFNLDKEINPCTRNRNAYSYAAKSRNMKDYKIHLAGLELTVRATTRQAAMNEARRYVKRSPFPPRRAA